MEQLPEIFIATRQHWREWLNANHDKSKGVWMVFYNKKSGFQSLTYDDFVEEALCFGWIDGTIKNIDTDRYVRKIMPRTNFSNWSASNRKRVEKLIEGGFMTEFGLAKIGNYSKTGELAWPEEKKRIVPIDFSVACRSILQQNSVALFNYINLSSSHQKRYIIWVMSAKQEATQMKRMKEAIPLLEKNHKNLIK
jgi:uncharacterized protein YdeI (YjbR/CyaY-like superfamily)